MVNPDYYEKVKAQAVEAGFISLHLSSQKGRYLYVDVWEIKSIESPPSGGCIVYTNNLTIHAHDAPGEVLSRIEKAKEYL